MLPMCHSPIGASDTSGIIIIYFFLLVKGNVKEQTFCKKANLRGDQREKLIKFQKWNKIFKKRLTKRIKMCIIEP